MKKGLYVFSVAFLCLCAVAVITCCSVFSYIENENHSEEPLISNPTQLNKDLVFEYGSSLTICFGDTKNISPTIMSNSDIYSLSYICTDPSVIFVDNDGDISAKKCGETTVEIKNHNITIKTVEISVNYEYELCEFFNCEIDGNKLYVNEETASFGIYIQNSSKSRTLINYIPALSCSEGIEARVKMGKIVLDAAHSGQIKISYPAYGIEIEIEIIVEN